MPGSLPTPQASGYGDFIDALHRARATSYERAVSLNDLPLISAEHLKVFRDADFIREAEPDTYYVTLAKDRKSMMPQPSPTYTPMRVALMMAMWLVAIAVPLVAWLIAR